MTGQAPAADGVPPASSSSSPATTAPKGFSQQPIVGVKEGFALLAFMAAIMFMMSFWIHWPTMSPNIYSDLMDAFYPRLSSATGIVPYVNYNLEYPVISAYVLWASSVWGNIYAFYITISSIIFASALGSIYVVYRALKERGEPMQRIMYFVIFTPVFIFYSIYNFDWTGAVFMVAAVYFGYKHQAMRSGVSMGLAIAARIIPIVCLPFIFFELQGRRDKIRLLVSTGLAWLVANLYFMVVDFHGWLYPYTFQAGFYDEDSWLGLFPAYSKDISIILLGISLGLILYSRKSLNLYQQSLLAMLAFSVFDYKFPPQYMIMLLPLFALTGVGYTEFMVANLLDMMIILWYFTHFFSFGDAIATSSPVQWISYLRQYALFLVYLKLLFDNWRRKTPVTTLRTSVAVIPDTGGGDSGGSSGSGSGPIPQTVIGGGLAVRTAVGGASSTDGGERAGTMVSVVAAAAELDTPTSGSRSPGQTKDHLLVTLGT
jgi:hypothetical protein